MVQFMVALMVKKYVDEAFRVQLVGQPAPEIKDLEYYQVTAVVGLCKAEERPVNMLICLFIPLCRCHEDGPCGCWRWRCLCW